MGVENGARNVQLLLLWRLVLWRLVLWRLVLYHLFLLPFLWLTQLWTNPDIQVSGHGEQHVRGFADPQLGLLDEVHLPILPLLLLVLGVLKPGHHSTSDPRYLHPPSPFGQVRSDENSVQEL